VSIGSGVLLYQGKEKQLLPGLVRELWRGTNGLEILVQYCAFPAQLADIQLDHLLLDGDEGEALPLPSNMLQPVTCDCACADAELVLTNEWGWEDASSVQQLCTIVRYDQYRSMYKLDHLRPPFNTYYYRYLLDNDSRIGQKPVVLLYNKLRPSLVARSLPGPTDLGLCTSKTFEMFASKVWQKVRSSLQHRGIKGMVTVDTTPEFLSAVAYQMPGSATRTTCCVSMYEGMHPGFIVAALCC
jgi:hypothetical protein